MVKNNFTNNARRLIAISVALMMMLATATISPTEIYATGRGEVSTGYSVLQPFLTEKTLDLTDSDIDIVLTEAEKKQCQSQADEWAVNWLQNIILFSDEAVQTTDEYKTFHKVRTNPRGSEEIYGGGFTDMYWFKDIIVPEEAASDETKALLSRIKSKGSIKEIANDSSLLEDICGVTGIDSEIASEVLNGKVNEIANDLISDKLTEQMQSKLSDFSFDFQAEEIASEDYAKYGIDGTAIKAGKLEKPVIIHTADFGASEQFYDEVLADGVKDALGGELIFDDDESGSFRVYSTERLSDIKDYLLRDGRDFIDHNMFINGGLLISSDGSQIAGGMLRGKSGKNMAEDFNDDLWAETKKQNYDFFRNISYPGAHALLGIADPFSTYSWARYGIPGAKYTQTFNLHLNPAVIYMAAYPKSDFVTRATFDKNGRLLTVSKPYAYEEEVIRLCQDGSFGSLSEGRYRYKITEISETESLGNGCYLLENNQEYLMDITKQTLFGADRYKVVFFADKDSDASKSSEFMNPITRTEIDKTVEGSDKITIKSLDQRFKYEINTVVPKGAAGFEVTDCLEDVLVFAGSDSIVVSVGGSALSDAEQSKVLSVDGKKLTVTLDEKQAEKYGGQDMLITFKAKLVDGINKDMLSVYENYTVPNVVNYSVSHVASNLVAIAEVEVPEEVLGTYKNDAETEESENGEAVKSADTGDDTNIMIWVLMLLGAFVSIAPMTVSRSRNNRR